MTDQPDTSSAPESASPPPSPDPPKGPRLRVLLLALLALAAGVALGALLDLPAMLDRSGSAGERPAAPGAAAGSHDHSAAIAPPTTKAGADAQQRYTCSMHPWVLEDEPGQCPICHMDLVPVSAMGDAGSGIVIDPVVAQNIGVRSAPVVSGPIARIIRTVGAIEHDDDAVRDVSLKVAGWIEAMRISRVGDVVDLGEPVLEIYSPELFAAQGEFLAAIAAQRRAGASGAGQMLVEDARQRLTLLGMSDDQIDALAARGQAQRTTTLRSPVQGVVLAKRVNEGAYVPAGAPLLRIADHSRVWVVAAVYEDQLPFVRPGQAARVAVQALPGRTYEGAIELIYPHVDADSRQAQVRIVVDNPEHDLLPGMFAQVEIRSELAGDRVLAPRSAIIDTGARTVALVQLAAGRFEPRDVHLGVEGEAGMVEVRSGLAPGERVVVSAQFLLDSEARLREALRAMTQPGAQDGHVQAPSPAAASEAGAHALNAPFAGSIRSALEAYLAIADALARNETKGVRGMAAELASALQAASEAAQDAGDADVFDAQLAQAALGAQRLSQAGDLPRARAALAQLSDALTPVVQAVGAPAGLPPLETLHCPMYREEAGGASWIQPAGQVRNPYMGPAMLGCFDERAPISAAAAQPTTGSDNP